MSATFGEIVERLRRVTVQVLARRSGIGSGVVWSADGRIVTNAHVVEGAGPKALEVALWDGNRLPAGIVERDRERDLAVLQIQGSGFGAATVGDSSAPRAGELVIAVGNPLGFIGAASTGVVHGFDLRSWVVSQLRLAPGNSGGPLANARGEIVGINTMIAGGLAFAVPSRAVTQFINRQLTNNPRLGVVVRAIQHGDSAQQFGLIVLEVLARSPADHASLLQGDVLVGTSSRRFQSIEDLAVAIDVARGGILDLQFRRGASTNIRTVAVQMAAPSVRAA